MGLDWAHFERTIVQYNQAGLILGSTGGKESQEDLETAGNGLSNSRKWTLWKEAGTIAQHRTSRRKFEWMTYALQRAKGSEKNKSWHACLIYPFRVNSIDALIQYFSTLHFCIVFLIFFYNWHKKLSHTALCSLNLALEKSDFAIPKLHWHRITNFIIITGITG